MTDIYLHGVETIEKNNGPRPVESIDTGVIGLAGIAPDADDTLWPYDTPIPIYGSNGPVQGLGDAGTLRDAIVGIFDQAKKVSQSIVVVRVREGATIAQTMQNIIGDPLKFTGIHAFRLAPSELGLKPKLLVAPGFTAVRPADGIKTIKITNAGKGYKSAPEIVIEGDSGTGATAVATIKKSTGELDEVILVSAGFSYTSVPSIKAVGGDPDEEAEITVEIGDVANPVSMALLSLANRLRAGVIKDSLATTTAAAIQDRMDFDTDRMLIVEPMVKVFKEGAVVSEPGSARIAGLQAVVDYTEGFWVSPSNHVVNGIVGTSRPIEHSITDPSAESQQLNKNAVSAFVRSPRGGFKLWGSRVPSSDPLNRFWSVRRAHDTIIDSVEIAVEPFIDRPFSLQNLVDIAETVNAALRRWKGLGATLGGRVWLDPTLNTKETWANGHIYISYDAEGPAPIEHITFMFNRNTGYYEELSTNAIRELNRMANTAISVN